MIHTIRNMKIRAVTQTIVQDTHLVCIDKNAFGNNIPTQEVVISNSHKIMYKGKMIRAADFLGLNSNIYAVPYRGEVLYNILMDTHEKMMIHNLIVETLHPEHRLAKLYNIYNFDKMSIKDQIHTTIELNKIVMAE